MMYYTVRDQPLILRYRLHKELKSKSDLLYIISLQVNILIGHNSLFVINNVDGWLLVRRIEHSCIDGMGFPFINHRGQARPRL